MSQSDAYIIEGTTVRFITRKPFTSIGGTPITPDKVTFKYAPDEDDIHTFVWINANTPPDPTYTIVNDGGGNFHADISTTGLPGEWQLGWYCEPDGGADTTKTAAVDEWTQIISVSEFDD